MNVWLEKRFARMGRGGMTRGLERLHDLPPRISTLAVAYGITVREVPVNTWHASVLGDGRIKREAAKLASINYVNWLFHIRTNDNQADAICIALYGQAKERLERLAR